jgi:hypothetical protein
VDVLIQSLGLWGHSTGAEGGFILYMDESSTIFVPFKNMLIGEDKRAPAAKYKYLIGHSMEIASFGGLKEVSKY